MKMRVFRNKASYSLAGVDRRFRRAYYVHDQYDDTLGAVRTSTLTECYFIYVYGMVIK
jgi:hypothetical protein